MNALTRALLLLALSALTTQAGAVCLRMEAPPPGTTAGVGPLLALPEGNVSLRPFLHTFWDAGGTSTIVVSNFAGGSPVQENNLNNITLVVVPTAGANVATFAYADFGGNVNLRVNGALANLPDLSAAPAVLGGVNVTVTRINLLGFHFGTVTLNGNINMFGVGGQELFVDDVCW